VPFNVPNPSPLVLRVAYEIRVFKLYSIPVPPLLHLECVLNFFEAKRHYECFSGNEGPIASDFVLVFPDEMKVLLCFYYCHLIVIKKIKPYFEEEKK